MSKKYFKTNAQLGILLADTNGNIDWEKYGFSIQDCIKNQYQHQDDNGEFVSYIPISDIAKFNEMLGGLIVIGEKDDCYYMVVDQSEKDTAKAIQDAKPVPMSVEEQILAQLQYQSMML